MLVQFNNVDNAAFQDEGKESEEALRTESARMLETIASKIREGSDGGICFDINGNRVGFWSL